ncbi:uncharacterized protein LOC119571356 [Penaeus monodon]|uniref:uncharacterized protein LOC119571356 n=1 Tax=Penaeus monodon TaxID=6687 RepID=UPI0018A6E8CC|nr:uncharacterized protein LOC119571356 [Penaeus monodon]
MLGMVVRAGCITVFLIFGIMFLLLGILMIEVIVLADMYAIPIAILIILWSIGAFLIYCYIKAKRKSLREFNALPDDHPDRLKYSNVYVPGTAPGEYPVTNVYHFPANAHGQTDGSGQAAALVSGHTLTPAYRPRQHASPQRNYPPSQEYPLPQGFYPIPQGPSAPPLQEPERKFSDDPPPYSEI